MGSYETNKYPTVAGQGHHEDCLYKKCESASKKEMASHEVVREQEEVDLLPVVIAQEIQISVLCKQVVAQEHQISALCEQVDVQEHRISVLSRQLAFLRLGFKRAQAVDIIRTSHFDGTFTGEIYESQTPQHTTKRIYKRAVHRSVLVAKSRVLRLGLQAAEMSKYFCLHLPTLRFRELRDRSVKDDDVFEVFIDYLYLAIISGPRLRLMWRDLLQLATEYEITALKEECEQFVERNVDINRYNILDILEVGWLCASEAVLRCALTKSFEDPEAPLLNLSDATYKKLVDVCPDLNDRVIQAEEAAKSRRAFTNYSKAFTKDSVDSTSLFLQIVTLCSRRNFFSWRPNRRVISSTYKL